MPALSQKNVARLFLPLNKKQKAKQCLVKNKPAQEL